MHWGYRSLESPGTKLGTKYKLAIFAAAADKAMRIAADCCIYTNDTFTKKSLKAEATPKEEPLALSEEEEDQS